MARKSKYRIRLLFFGTISVVIIGYFLVSFTAYFANIRKLKKENESLQQELINMKENEENLKVEIQKLKDPEYIARYARENYLYSKDGEYIINIKESDKTSESNSKNDFTKLYVICSGIGLILIVGYVVFKPKKDTKIKKGN